MTPDLIDTLQRVSQALRVVQSQHLALERMEAQHPWLALLQASRDELRTAIDSIDDLLESEGLSDAY